MVEFLEGVQNHEQILVGLRTGEICYCGAHLGGFWLVGEQEERELESG